MTLSCWCVGGDGRHGVFAWHWRTRASCATRMCVQTELIAALGCVTLGFRCTRGETQASVAMKLVELLSHVDIEVRVG